MAVLGRDDRQSRKPGISVAVRARRKKRSRSDHEHYRNPVGPPIIRLGLSHRGRQIVRLDRSRASNSREMDIVTVTSGGAAVPGATVSVSGQPTPTFTVVTNAHGVALITHVPCYSSGTQIPAPGRSLPVPLLVPCVATVSMAGYQPASITLP